MYATGLLAPYYTYHHDVKVVPGETCGTGSSIISGISFYSGSTYPAAYKDALLFAELQPLGERSKLARRCRRALGEGELRPPGRVEERRVGEGERCIFGCAGGTG